MIPKICQLTTEGINTVIKSCIDRDIFPGSKFRETLN